MNKKIYYQEEVHTSWQTPDGEIASNIQQELIQFLTEKRKFTINKRSSVDWGDYITVVAEKQVEMRFKEDFDLEQISDFINNNKKSWKWKSLRIDTVLDNRRTNKLLQVSIECFKYSVISPKS